MAFAHFFCTILIQLFPDESPDAPNDMQPPKATDATAYYESVCSTHAKR
jgi:hypothetical protein